MGATACVNKPFDLDSLVALVKATLDDGIGQKSLNWSGSVRTVLFNYSQPLLLEIHDGEHTGQYHSRIEEKDDRTLTVTCPVNENGPVPLKPGSPVSIGFAGEDAFYSFETAVLAVRDSYTPTVVVGKPAVIYRVQRRKHARMPARIPVEMALVEKGPHGDVPSIGPVFRVFTQDIGAGGFKIVTEERFESGATVKIQASDIPGLDEFSGTAKITRAIKLPSSGHQDWEYGIQFTKVDDEQRFTLAKAVEAGALA
jgi:c-di-GMP-binding flagellar brake protein YcgR